MLLLTGCFGGGSPVPQDTFYRLPDVTSDGGVVINSGLGVIAVSSLKSDALYRERAILYSENSSPLTIKRYHYHHWTTTPNHLIQENLIDFLRKQNVARQIVRYGQQNKVDAHISGYIKRFERITGGSGEFVIVELELQIELLASHKRKVLYRDYKIKREAANSSMQAAVESFGSALIDIYKQFLSDLRNEKII